MSNFSLNAKRPKIGTKNCGRISFRKPLSLNSSVVCLLGIQPGGFVFVFFFSVSLFIIEKHTSLFLFWTLITLVSVTAMKNVSIDYWKTGRQIRVRFPVFESDFPKFRSLFTAHWSFGRESFYRDCATVKNGRLLDWF